MKIYCDESNSDVFTSKLTKAQYMAIGAIKFSEKYYKKFTEEINDIKKKFDCFNEFKWNKVSPSKEDFYIELIDFFFRHKDELQFRCIVIDKNRVNLIKYHQSDAELSFYKFYYLLLHYWIDDFELYSIFVDIKTNRVKNRLKELKQCLRNSNLSSEIKSIQALPSNEVVFIQLVDLLTGAVCAKFNNCTTSNSKKKVIVEIEKHIKQPIKSTVRSEKKFNIFKIELKK